MESGSTGRAVGLLVLDPQARIVRDSGRNNFVAYEPSELRLLFCVHPCPVSAPLSCERWRSRKRFSLRLAPMRMTGLRVCGWWISVSAVITSVLSSAADIRLHTPPWRVADLAFDRACSRVLSREAAAIIQRDVLREAAFVSQACPLLPAQGLFAGEEALKQHVRGNIWQCGVCSKQFRGEVYVDLHLALTNAHATAAPAADAFCLADFCGLLGCPSLFSLLDSTQSAAYNLTSWLAYAPGTLSRSRNAHALSSEGLAVAGGAVGAPGAGSFVRTGDVESRNGDWDAQRTVSGDPSKPKLVQAGDLTPPKSETGASSEESTQPDENDSGDAADQVDVQGFAAAIRQRARQRLRGEAEPRIDRTSKADPLAAEAEAARTGYVDACERLIDSCLVEPEVEVTSDPLFSTPGPVADRLSSVPVPVPSGDSSQEAAAAAPQVPDAQAMLRGAAPAATGVASSPSVRFAAFRAYLLEEFCHSLDVEALSSTVPDEAAGGAGGLDLVGVGALSWHSHALAAQRAIAELPPDAALGDVEAASLSAGILDMAALHALAAERVQDAALLAEARAASSPPPLLTSRNGEATPRTVNPRSGPAFVPRSKVRQPVGTGSLFTKLASALGGGWVGAALSTVAAVSLLLLIMACAVWVAVGCGWLPEGADLCCGCLHVLGTWFSGDEEEPQPAHVRRRAPGRVSDAALRGRNAAELSHLAALDSIVGRQAPPGRGPAGDLYPFSSADRHAGLTGSSTGVQRTHASYQLRTRRGAIGGWDQGPEAVEGTGWDDESYASDGTASGSADDLIAVGSRPAQDRRALRATVADGGMFANQATDGPAPDWDGVLARRLRRLPHTLGGGLGAQGATPSAAATTTPGSGGDALWSPSYATQTES